MSDKTPFVLMVLDGFGLNTHRLGNAIAQARTPNITSIMEKYSHTELEASGEGVGLPEGQIGGSEVGHLNLGAGRIPYQDLSYINKKIKDGDFFNTPALVEAMDTAKSRGTKLHLMGLVSPGGVHSHSNHIYALLKMAKDRGLSNVYIHAFLDGRDVPPASALEYILDLEAKEKEIGIGEIATVIGRYYAMDRDNRWERVERAYKAIVLGKGDTVSTSAPGAVQAAYDAGQTDEFVLPTVIIDAEGQPKATIDDGDAVIFFNFRADRAVEITKSLLEEDFDKFPREKKADIAYYACFMEYIEAMDLPVAFEVPELTNSLPEYFSNLGMKQLRIAETEKFRHVTLFFNAGREDAFPGEERVLIPSPKVATYDLKPEMSAYEITDEVIKRIKSREYDFIVLNYANADMVGHTGMLEPAIKAIETVDECVGRVVETVLGLDGTILMTADHGNADQMVDPSTGDPHTAHTMNLVPFVVIKNGYHPRLRKGGTLGDVAPTILEMMNIPKPAEMTCDSLIEK